MGAGLLVLLAAPLSADAYLDALDTGLDRCAAGHWDIALKEFAAAAAVDPDDPLAYIGQGLCHLAERRLDQAAAFFRRAEQSDRAVAVSALGLGLCYLSVGDQAAASGLFQRAVTLDDGLPAPRFYLAVLALCDGDLGAAESYLRRADELGAPGQVLDYTRALRLVAAGRWAEAATALRRLEPRAATELPGLPLALPLEVIHAADGSTSFSIPRGPAIGELVAPRMALGGGDETGPARFGPLTVESPLPGEIVSDRIPIRMRLLQAWNYRMVSVKIDGRLLGMTNREPLYLVWDTRHVDDGPHTIDVTASGLTEHTASLRVTVQNRAAGTNPHPAEAYRQRLRRLGGFFLHSLPSQAVEELMRQAYREQDPELALELCERVLARDAARVDVVPELVALYRQQAVALSPESMPEPRHGIAGGRRVALTFDDGPRPDFTPDILAALAQYRARATFLVTGRMCERYPELVRQIASAGHEVASHTYNHYRLDGLSEGEVVYELIKIKVILDDLLGGSARFFRPPGGHYSPSVRRIVAALGYFPVFWSVNGGEYRNLPPRQAAMAVMRRITDGGIVLLHNGPDNTLPMLPHLLEFLTESGYRLVTVSDILRAPADTAPLELAGGPGMGPLSPDDLAGYAGTE